jgi:dual specificity protein kinase YAK1
MDPQWSSYQDPAGSSRRFNGHNQISREYNGQMQSQPPAGFKYEQYQGAATTQNSTVSPITTPQLRDGNGDIAMQDAGHDQYGSLKYPLRPHHQSHLSGGRPANLHSAQEPSSAAQRYSPMEALSPTSPYAPKSAMQSQFASPTAQRQSPTRQTDYIPQSPYYAGRQPPQQLPPITPLCFGT